MSLAAVSEPKVSVPSPAVYQYLLLGELRSSLEDDDPSDESRGWLLAVLDRLLASYPRGGVRPPTLTDGQVTSGWVQKLQRLRDRVAHRAPFQILANEVRCDLIRLMDQQRSVRSE